MIIWNDSKFKKGTLCVHVSAKQSAKELYKCHALKIKSIQIIFKQETHSNIISTLTIHNQTSLNFDDKKQIYYIGIDAQYQYHSIVHHPCQDIRKSTLYSLSVPTLTVSTKLLLQNF